MRTVGVFEARTRPTVLLDEVGDGAEILVARRGTAIARLVPADAGHDRAPARRAAGGLRPASRGQTLGGIALVDLVRRPPLSRNA